METTCIFKRIEKKYLLSEAQYEKLFRRIGAHLWPDEHGLSTVLSLYLDTEDHRIIRGSAAPYGVTGEKCRNALKAAGIVYCRTTVSTEKFSMPKDWLELPATCHHGNPRLFELGKSFLGMENPRAPQLFYVWGHSYEFDDADNWDVIEKFCDLMGGHSDKIWYATNGEIYDYTEAYNRLVWSVEMDRVTNPTFTELWFSYGNQTYRIMPGETITF